MASNQELTLRQERFAHLYLANGGNATLAYKEAGYAVGNENIAAASGSTLLRNPKVQAFLDARRQKLSTKLQITQERVLTELARLGFTDMRNYIEWDSTGVRMKPSGQLTDDQAAAVLEVQEHKTVTVRTSKDGDTFETTNTQVKFKLADKEGPLDKLAKHLDLYPKGDGGNTFIGEIKIVWRPVEGLPEPRVIENGQGLLP